LKQGDPTPPDQKGQPSPEEARERLFARLDSKRESEKALVAGRPALMESRATDFSSLPAYEDIRVQHRIAERYKLANPYFRVHEGRNGARTQIGGRDLLNFSSYDYLGLNGHPDVVAAAKAAIDRYGVSASGSRHVSGERPVHRQLERALADHYSVDDSVVFVSGYATNLGVVGHLVGPKDIIIYDAAIHNSVVIGSVLSGAARRSFIHNDLDNLEQVLAQARGSHERALIVVEGHYSMDGDYPDLPRLIEIKKRFAAWLMVDEAHSIGVLGDRGYGIYEHFSVNPKDVDIWMGTLSKTLVGCGGYIAGSAQLIEYLKLTAGAFVYSVAMPPVIAASCLAALEIMHREPERVARLRHNGLTFREVAKKRGLNVGAGVGSAICPVIIGDSLPTALLSQKLLERGVNVLPVLYPAVAPNEARLRFFLTAMHTDADIEAGIEATVGEIAKLDESMQALNIPGYSR
jgi:8-amino-7-oxononanoate synthase